MYILYLNIDIADYKNGDAFYWSYMVNRIK